MAIDFPNSPTTGQEFTSGLNTWTYDGAKWISKATTAYSNESAPVGTIVNFAGPTASIPAGWFACDGSAISRGTYSTLFATIGTTYGSGDGSTTFNLPTIQSTTGVFVIRYTTTLGTTATDSLYTAPVGSMLTWPKTSGYPTGWLRADGSAVSRTSYADLFALIGTTYGTGDGSTTFNVPNMVETGGPVHIIKATTSGGQQPAVVAHSDKHVRLGSDIIDGDRLQVDYVPTGYARDSSDAAAGANTDLTAHLKGIDTYLRAHAVSAVFVSNTAYTPGANNAIPFGAENYDTDNFHDNNTNNSRITIPAGLAGTYMFEANVGFNFSTIPTYVEISIRHNGTMESSKAIRGGMFAPANSSSFANYHASGIAYGCVAGDYFDVCFNVSGGTYTSTPLTGGLSTVTPTYFRAVRIAT